MIIHHADETAPPPSTANTGLHCAHSQRSLLCSTDVHQSEVAVNYATGTSLSHVVQHYCFKWLYHNNQGEICS